MAFTSYVFIAFFIAVYATYWACRNKLRAQNLLLLVASYVFYGYWDWRFCSLLLISTVCDYIIAKKIFASNNDVTRKRLVTLSLAINLGILGFFKYFNFFADSLNQLAADFGFAFDQVTLNIILPVGISFYTFQTLSYTIDVYRRKMQPVDSVLDFGVYVAYFPQLVAGPIERASHLLPQVVKPRTFDINQINAGLYLILWGFFKKLVIADNAAGIANTIFNNHEQYAGLDLWIGTLAFAFQIYCDFSAYSDIARGLSKLMGFDLMLNFRLPYFATSPSDFWRRWHISLSTWLRDYLYIPLGGNRGSNLVTQRNLLLTMLLGGLWHGAAWNFVLWGLYHGIILALYRAFDKTGDNSPLQKPKDYLRLALRMAFMFVLTLFGWVLFRCHSLDQIAYFFSKMHLGVSDHTATFAYELGFFVLPLIVIQIAQQKSRDLMIMMRLPFPLRTAYYALLIAWISIFGVREAVEFIYFQF